MSSKKPKRKTGRPPKQVEKIPDTFENVVKALVKPSPKKKPPKAGT